MNKPYDNDPELTKLRHELGRAIYARSRALEDALNKRINEQTDNIAVANRCALVGVCRQIIAYHMEMRKLFSLRAAYPHERLPH